MADNKNVTTLEYKCPHCESDNRLAGSLAEKVKKRGLMREELYFAAWKFEGKVGDPTKDAIIPYGSSLPYFRIYMDVCLDCGCMYACRVDILQVVKTLKPKQGGAPFSGN